MFRQQMREHHEKHHNTACLTISNSTSQSLGGSRPRYIILPLGPLGTGTGPRRRICRLVPVQTGYYPPRCPATLQVVLLFLSLSNSQVPLFLHSLPVPLLCRGSAHQHLMRLCPNLLACLFPLAHRFQLFTPCRLRHHFTISSFSFVLFLIAFHCRWNASFYSGFLVKHIGLACL
ncbi:hypothetical protein NOF04DRAFT_1084633 [Fusarium oxysporum II5]|nr:hypothetical protein NOF04DRAFT_1084633 [Fusarium oxysporum II5]